MKKSDVWETTGTNLKRYIPSGTYYVSAKLLGRRVRESLGTSNLQAARDKLHKWLDMHRSNGSGAGTGATMGALIELWEKQLAEDTTITDTTRKYKNEVLDYVIKNWPGIKQTKVRGIKHGDAKAWAKRQTCGPTRVNGALTVLRELFDLAEARGVLRGVSPMKGIKNLPVGIKPFNLPTREQMEQIRDSVYTSSKHAGLLFDLLAETGSRISTATSICWEHVDWSANRIYYEKVKCKAGGYYGPMSRKLREVLGAAKPGIARGTIAPVQSIRKPLETACRHIGITPAISHHDLRHWFVTRCLERGVDIPTVAEWVGHADGGVLLLQTYSHLRDEHSQEMAKLL
jgi:integrase